MQRYLCVIPARGGSKGVPRKNLRPVGGKPLIAWTVEHALACPDVRVVVSTDDEEIAEVARTWGAEVPFLRDSELAADETPTEPVLLDALARLEQLDGHRPDAVILLQATSPVRRPDAVARAVAQFEAERPDSLVGVCEASPFLWRESGTPLYDVAHRPRRQDLRSDQRVWRETGSLYITRTELLEAEQNRLGGTIALFRMHDDESIDIDTELDLAVAEALLGAHS